jgi:hypothetical protein
VKTETVEDMGSLDTAIKMTASASEVERAAIRELVVAARARGEDLTGPDGLLKLLTKTVLEAAWRRSCPSTWDMTSTPSRAATAPTPATASGRRP